MSDYTYETTRPVEVELEGVRYHGKYWAISGSVIVYFQDEIKFAQFGMDSPETVARWLLSDLCRKVKSKQRKKVRHIE